MTKYLAKNLINLSNRCLCPNRSTELCLNHAESGFNIRPLMVVLQEGFPIKVIEVPHMTPETIKLVVMVAHASGVRLEGNISCATYCLSRLKISAARICFVSRDLIDIECFGGCIYQWSELEIISRLIRSSFYTRNDMGVYPTNKVSLNPSLLAAFLPILVVKPTGICCGGEAGGVNGKVSLYSLQWTGALLNQIFQKWCQFRILQIAENAGKRWGLSNQALHYCFSTVGHEAPTGHGGVDLIGGLRQSS